MRERVVPQQEPGSFRRDAGRGARRQEKGPLAGRVGLLPGFLELRVGRVGLEGLDRQSSRRLPAARTPRTRQEMEEPRGQDPVQQRQQEQDQENGRGDDDRADPLEAAREMLEHLEEAEEEPLGPGRVVGARGIGRQRRAGHLP